MMQPQSQTLIRQAHQLIDLLPEDATGRDVAHRAAVRADIEAGLADSVVNRVTPVEEVLKEFGLADE